MSFSIEDLTFHLFSYLESLPGFRGLEYDQRPGATPAALSAWQRGELGLGLPDDLAGFLEFTDGFNLKWRASGPTHEVVVGSVSLSGVAQLARLDGSGPSPAALKACASARAEAGEAWDELGAWVGSSTVAAFALESNPKVGDSALVYPLDANGGAKGPPEVWFRDRAGGWHWVARSFGAYWRLLLVHLGVLGWQSAFTPQGLNPLTVQWMRLYCPERLILDSAHHQRQQQVQQLQLQLQQALSSPP